MPAITTPDHPSPTSEIRITVSAPASAIIIIIAIKDSLEEPATAADVLTLPGQP